MSAVSRPGGFTRRLREVRANKESAKSTPLPAEIPPEAEEESMEQLPPISKEERRIYIFAALKAALLIGLAFIAGLGIVIWLLDAFWF